MSDFLQISPIFDKWQNSPTYTSINTTNYPVWSMPFPGVTICSNLMVNLNLLSGALKRTAWKSIKAEDTYSSLTDEAFKKVVEGALVIASQVLFQHALGSYQSGNDITNCSGTIQWRPA